MLAHFREFYPMGSVITDLLRVEEGIFLIKAQIVVNSTILGTGIAGSPTVEEAESMAINRALNHAGLNQTGIRPVSTPFTIPPSGLVSPGISSLESSANGGSNSSEGPGSSWQPPLPSSTPKAGLEVPPVAPNPLDPADSFETEDLSELIAQSSVEIERIGWTNKEGRDFLRSRFRKDARSQLDKNEMKEFLRHLKQQPTRLTKESPF